jgi:FAD/FMN-containing dehydrogenase
MTTLTQPHTQFHNRQGQAMEVPAPALAQLRSQLSSTVAPGEPGYEAAREIWNAMIRHRPALVATCRDAAEVALCVRFANQHGIALAVRGGGHNIGGRALVEGSLLVDFSAARDVTLDETTGEVLVAAGARLGDLDRATAPRGWVVPSGIVSATGVAGLTLGGGFGWLSRRFGLTCDHLQAAEVVTANGDRRLIDQSSDPDLLWALRGGGGGFGIVTSFRFAARRLQPTVLAGPVFHAPEATERVATWFLEQTARLGEEVGSMLKLGAAPALPTLPAAVHGRPNAAVLLCHSGGDLEQSARELAPLRTGGPGGEPALLDLVQPRPFDAFQAMFDAGEPNGRHNYWKSEYVTHLDEEMLAILLSAHAELPSPSANIKVFSLGGAVTRVPADQSAAAHRDARYIVVFASSWNDPAADDANISWVRRGWSALHARSGRGGYVNFLTEDRSPEEATAALSGVDAERLAAVKRRWDPDNVFGPALASSAATGSPAGTEGRRAP